MASVPLRFIPPGANDIEKMKIYESPTQDGTFNLIETVTDIGTYPNYIDHYTTNAATAVNYWFAIAWEDDKGASSGLSQAIQGNTVTLVGLIVDRLILRDPDINENIAAEEARLVVQNYFNVDDPNEVNPATLRDRIIAGLSWLALARVYVTRALTASTEGGKWSAGIVGMDASSSKVDTKVIDQIVKQANRDLGLNLSTIMLLKETRHRLHTPCVVGVDQSRLIFEIE